MWVVFTPGNQRKKLPILCLRKFNDLSQISKGPFENYIDKVYNMQIIIYTLGP